MTERLINNKRTQNGKNRLLLLWAKRILKGIIIFIIALLVIGIIYEKVGSNLDYKKYKPVGEIIKVNGHDMHIYVEGDGNETVVFASGLGTTSPYVDFYPLYNEISKSTRVAVYERPGYGWSEVSNSPRDIDTITKELHELLEKSDAKAPYILVGHSLGSLEILRFAQLYKDEVKGIVTIDGGNPEFYSTYKGGNKNSVYDLAKVCKKTGIARFLINETGLYNSFISGRNNLNSIPENMIDIDKAMFVKNLFNKNIRDEGKNENMNALTVIENGYINDIPLRIVTAQRNVDGIDVWLESQSDFKEWSTDSEQIVIKDAQHYIHHYAPDEVIKEIKEILDK